jgi:F0F1-type ATP synthase membrane subunit c/vacuolar-type H+-ATPase subunit K
MQSRHRILHLIRFPWPVAIAIVFITSALVTFLFWLILPATFQINENSDYTLLYEPGARNILEGHGFRNIDGTPIIRRPPGYPLILAGLFGLSQFLSIREETVLATFSILSMGLTSVFVFMLAQSIWGPRPALVSSLVWMTYPFALWLTKQPNSEIPFQVVFYGGFCLFWYALLCKSRTWPIFFLSGLLVGFATLIRPIGIGVGFIMGAMIWLVRREVTPRLRLFLITVILLGNVVAILPWEVWVYYTTGRVVILSTNGVSVIRQGLTYAVGRDFPQGAVVPQGIETLMRDFRARNDELQSLGGVVSAITEALRTRPVTVAKLFALKAARSWYGTYTHRHQMPILLIQMLYLIMIFWSSLVTWKQGGITKQMAIGIWLMVLYFWGMTIISWSMLRYMVPVMGLLFVLAPAALLTRRPMEAEPSQK